MYHIKTSKEEYGMAGVNFSARELVDSAKKAGHDTKAIAKLCNVAESSVRRVS